MAPGIEEKNMVLPLKNAAFSPCFPAKILGLHLGFKGEVRAKFRWSAKEVEWSANNRRFPFKKTR